MATAERIKELRNARGWTQQQLAERVGVTKQSVSIWENGKQAISRESLETLCDVFNVQMDYILCKQDITMRFLSSEELHIVDAYRHLSYDQQTMICDMLHVKRDQDASNQELSSTSSLGA